MLECLGLAFFVLNLNDSVASTLKFLNEQSGILSLSSILAAIVVFFYQQHSERKKFNERIINACKALMTDLGEIDKAYSSGELIKTTLIERDIDFTNTSIGTEYYQRVVNSGIITYFGKETQIELSNVYYNIFLFNEGLREANHFVFFSPLEKSIQDTIIDNVAQKLTKHENEIKTKIPVVKRLLEAEIQKLRK